MDKLIQWLTTELTHKSPRTLQTYTEAVKKLWRETNLNELATLSSADVMSLYANWSGSTNALAHYDRVWRAIFTRVEKRGRLPLGLPTEWLSPWRTVERVRARQVEKVPLSGKEIRKLLQANVPFKELVLVRLLATTGMRVSEALGLYDSDLLGEAVRIVGKGGDSRLVYISEELGEDLEQLRLMNGDIAQLFPWTRTQAYEVVKRAGEAVGIHKLHPHLLRHSYISLMLNEKGAPLKFVQEQVGHRNVATTMRYSHMLPEQKVEMVKRFKV